MAAVDIIESIQELNLERPSGRVSWKVVCGGVQEVQVGDVLALGAVGRARDFGDVKKGRSDLWYLKWWPPWWWKIDVFWVQVWRSLWRRWTTLKMKNYWCFGIAKALGAASGCKVLMVVAAGQAVLGLAAVGWRPGECPPGMVDLWDFPSLYTFFIHACLRTGRTQFFLTREKYLF